MINLRFHIVSIVAVFLALAVGIFAGSTLLDRATVNLVRSNQASLDAKNKALRSENDTIRNLIEGIDSRSKEFGDSALDPLVGRQLRSDLILLVATRGIDEKGVAAAVATLRNAGGSMLGIVWLDQRTDPGGADDAVRKLAAFVGLDSIDLSGAKHADSVAKVTTQLVDMLATPLESATAPGPPPTSGVAPVTSDALAGVLRRMVDAQLVDWESLTGGDQTPPDLPSAGVRAIVVSGEGAEVAPSRLIVPLVKAVSAKRAGVIVAELDHSRRLLDQANSKFRRGAVVDPLRGDDATAERTVTVDNLDQPFGRLALVLALADLDQHPSGAYGETSTAQRQFPGGS